MEGLIFPSETLIIYELGIYFMKRSTAQKKKAVQESLKQQLEQQQKTIEEQESLKQQLEQQQKTIEEQESLKQQLEQQQKIIEEQRRMIDQIRSEMELVQLEKEEAQVEGEGAQELSKNLLAQVNLLTIQGTIVRQLAEYGVGGPKLVACMDLMNNGELLLKWDASANGDILHHMLELVDEGSASLSIAPPAPVVAAPAPVVVAPALVSVVENSGSPLKLRAEEHKGNGGELSVAASETVAVELSGVLQEESL